MEGIAVIHRQGGTELQIMGQAPQIRQPLDTLSALRIVFILVPAMALQTRIDSVHGILLILAHSNQGSSEYLVK
jgi:hypothetical protein